MLIIWLCSNDNNVCLHSMMKMLVFFQVLQKLGPWKRHDCRIGWLLQVLLLKRKRGTSRDQPDMYTTNEIRLYRWVIEIAQFIQPILISFGAFYRCVCTFSLPCINGHTLSSDSVMSRADPMWAGLALLAMTVRGWCGQWRVRCQRSFLGKSIGQLQILDVFSIKTHERY